MDPDTNPYAPPQAKELATSLRLPSDAPLAKSRKMAASICAFAVGISGLFAILDDAIVQTRIGSWPIVFATAALSVLSAFLTKDRIFAPLTCFASIMGSCLVVALTHNLEYAQLHLALPVSFAFSIPALLIAGWFGRHQQR